MPESGFFICGALLESAFPACFARRTALRAADPPPSRNPRPPRRSSLIFLLSRSLAVLESIAVSMIRGKIELRRYAKFGVCNKQSTKFDKCANSFETEVKK